MHQQVQKYYSETLQSSDDLQTNACCTDTSLSSEIKAILSNIHPEVLKRYYGCGLVVPEALTDCHILDLGCGAGRDCYALAQLVGENGSVTGVDMTDRQLAVAKQYIEHHKQIFNFNVANTRFYKGYIEQLDQLPIAAGSLDVIVSNCVINLCPDKASVLAQAYQLLKPGGEMYFSDVYADRRVPAHLTEDEQLYGECLSGALYWQDFEQLAKQAGFLSPRIVESRKITVDNDVISEKLDGIAFTSITYRLFKAEQLEENEQDYQLTASYQGGIDNSNEFSLDANNQFKQGQATAISANTWQILKQSRFAGFFTFSGDLTCHYGPFLQPQALSLLDFVNDGQSPSCCPTNEEKLVNTSNKGCC